MVKRNNILLKFSKYAVVGCVSTLCYFIFIFILVELLYQEPVFSSAVSFLLMTLIAYFLNRRYTFHATANMRGTFIKYIAVSGVGFILNSSIMYIVVYTLSFHYTIGELVTIIVIPIINFVLNNYWTFKEA